MLSLLWCRTTVGFLHFPYTFTDCKIFFKLDQVLTITTVLRGLTCRKLATSGQQSIAISRDSPSSAAGSSSTGFVSCCTGRELTGASGACRGKRLLESGVVKSQAISIWI